MKRKSLNMLWWSFFFLFLSILPDKTMATSAGVVNASDMGMVCDGHYDNTAILQELFHKKEREISIILPPGTCVFREPISMTLNRASISGAGGAATILAFDGIDTNSDLITLRDAYGVKLEHFGLWSLRRRQGGAALHLLRSSYITIDDMHINDFQTKIHSLWHALWIDQPNFVTANNLYLQAQKDALLLSAKGAGSPYQYDVFVSNSKLSESEIGMHVAGGIDNVHIDSSEVTSNNNNIVDDNSIFPAVNQEIYIGPGVVLDQSLYDNVVINDKLCNRTDYGFVSISGAVTHSKHGSGIFVQSFPNCELSINSPLIAKNEIDGISVHDLASYINVSSSVFLSDNGRYGIYYSSFPNRARINAIFVSNGKGERGIGTRPESGASPSP